MNKELHYVSHYHPLICQIFKFAALHFFFLTLEILRTFPKYFTKSIHLIKTVEETRAPDDNLVKSDFDCLKYGLSGTRNHNGESLIF